MERLAPPVVVSKQAQNAFLGRFASIFPPLDTSLNRKDWQPINKSSWLTSRQYVKFDFAFYISFFFIIIILKPSIRALCNQLLDPVSPLPLLCRRMNEFTEQGKQVREVITFRLLLDRPDFTPFSTRKWKGAG